MRRVMLAGSLQLQTQVLVVALPRISEEGWPLPTDLEVARLDGYVGLYSAAFRLASCSSDGSIYLNAGEFLFRIEDPDILNELAPYMLSLSLDSQWLKQFETHGGEVYRLFLEKGRRNALCEYFAFGILTLTDLITYAERGRLTMYVRVSAQSQEMVVIETEDIVPLTLWLPYRRCLLSRAGRDTTDLVEETHKRIVQEVLDHARDTRARDVTKRDQEWVAIEKLRITGLFGKLTSETLTSEQVHEVLSQLRIRLAESGDRAGQNDQIVRLEFLRSLGPDKWIVPSSIRRGSWQDGLVVAYFSEMGYVVLASPNYGEATYILPLNGDIQWEDVTAYLSRSELQKIPGVVRIIHHPMSDWRKKQRETIFG
jgi:hypothetical protein